MHPNHIFELDYALKNFWHDAEARKIIRVPNNGPKETLFGYGWNLRVIQNARTTLRQKGEIKMNLGVGN
jgi:hypothetical protein